jgi:5-methylcytosine-specific restriction endonuclease McrA
MIRTSCGTYSGYSLHQRHGESQCDACRQAGAEYKRAYREANKEKVAQTIAAWQQANKAKVNATSRKWRARHPEKRKEVVNSYWKANPEKRRELSRRRRAQIKLSPIDGYTDAQVLELYGIDCHICSKPIDLTASRRSGHEGWEKGLHIDHVIPICNNGSDTIDNVRPAHGWCNVSRNKKELAGKK